LDRIIEKMARRETRRPNFQAHFPSLTNPKPANRDSTPKKPMKIMDPWTIGANGYDGAEIAGRTFNRALVESARYREFIPPTMNRAVRILAPVGFIRSIEAGGYCTVVAVPDLQYDVATSIEVPHLGQRVAP